MVARLEVIEHEVPPSFIHPFPILEVDTASGYEAFLNQVISHIQLLEKLQGPWVKRCRTAKGGLDIALSFFYIVSPIQFPSSLENLRFRDS